MIPLSVLDLCPVPEGATPREALANTLDLARHAEDWGYGRYWLAEHHNMVGIASAATSVVIGHVAAGTSRIRVGAGGVMLPNHSPLVIAEQFGTLASLFPGRIDLGLGRAPGGDRATARALRRDLESSADQFPQDVVELQGYLADPEPGQRILAVPGAGTNVPLWILGSSLFGAQLAAMLGLPYAFASHFAPDALMPAIETYRARFRPSAQLDRPHVMLGVNVIAADTDEEARRQFTTLQQAFVRLRRGDRGKLQPPIDRIEDFCSPDELAGTAHALKYSFVGGPETVHAGMAAFVKQTGADELMVTGQIYDHQARLNSYRITAGKH
ncbi:LLM class flavin-dependent oxidoreductase [Fodinicurvata sp. EGI_FJ10296]|uniref:LLM class flavin-dependent oxidoreductase n=1 Tax=Fodinicurvata sp. EGI_FJ10296 TaxID=3231908 RepID=UPI00345555B0